MKLSRVIVADDHAIVRAGTIRILESINSVEICAQVSDGLQAIAQSKLLKPDLMVLDSAMPFASGMEVLTECKRWSKQTAIVLLTGLTSTGLLRQWIDAEVDGVLLKTCDPEEMRKCFQVVLAGGKYVCMDAQNILEKPDAHATLTHRESEVLTMVARGMSNKAIAERLSVSIRTVEKHRGSMMEKLGVNSISELMLHALKAGLLDEHHQL